MSCMKAPAPPRAAKISGNAYLQINHRLRRAPSTRSDLARVRERLGQTPDLSEIAVAFDTSPSRARKLRER
ncbi:MAG: hypothetical protein WA840_13580 [Caulobacteraceae bacterium]